MQNKLNGESYLNRSLEKKVSEFNLEMEMNKEIMCLNEEKNKILRDKEEINALYMKSLKFSQGSNADFDESYYKLIISQLSEQLNNSKPSNRIENL